MFWVSFPVFLMMCISTIWGRYHYVADVLAGMITGTLGYLVGSRIMEWPGAVKMAAELEMPTRRDAAEHVAR